MAGPMITPSWFSTWTMAEAVEICSVRTSRGTIAFRVGLSKAVSPDAMAGRTNSGHNRTPTSVLMPSPALHNAMTSSTRMSSLRRSVASMTVPPYSEQISSGMSWARDTKPTSSDEPVSRYTWYGIATAVSWLPSSDTSCPASSQRRSRDSRSGVRSIKIRRRGSRGIEIPA